MTATRRVHLFLFVLVNAVWLVSTQSSFFEYIIHFDYKITT